MRMVGHPQWHISLWHIILSHYVYCLCTHAVASHINTCITRIYTYGFSFVYLDPHWYIPLSHVMIDIFICCIAFPSTCAVYTHTHSYHTQMYSSHKYTYTGLHAHIPILIDIFLVRMSSLISSSFAYHLVHLRLLSMHTRLLVTRACMWRVVCVCIILCVCVSRGVCVYHLWCVCVSYAPCSVSGRTGNSTRKR